ncbi:MAG: hypothetical protein H6622_13405 [Halobacteriovoraceae bacterium]|nr:hypothetical protein [Halobacteriovoraceae bacterium]
MKSKANYPDDIISYFKNKDFKIEVNDFSKIIFDNRIHCYQIISSKNNDCFIGIGTDLQKKDAASKACSELLERSLFIRPKDHGFFASAFHPIKKKAIDSFHKEFTERQCLYSLLFGINPFKILEINKTKLSFSWSKNIDLTEYKIFIDGNVLIIHEASANYKNKCFIGNGFCSGTENGKSINEAIRRLSFKLFNNHDSNISTIQILKERAICSYKNRIHLPKEHDYELMSTNEGFLCYISSRCPTIFSKDQNDKNAYHNLIRGYLQ